MAQFLPSRYNLTCVLAASRYKLSGDRYQVMVQECCSKALEQRRGTNLIEASIESWYRSLRAGR